MVIVKVNANIHPTTLAELREGIRKQARTGALVLPAYCELLAEVPDGTEVEVVAGRDPASYCRECEYKRYYDRVAGLDDCNTCGKSKECPHAPRIGDLVRINCPLWVPGK